MWLLLGGFSDSASTVCDACFFFFFISFYSKHFLLKSGVLPNASAVPAFLPTIELMDGLGPLLAYPSAYVPGPWGWSGFRQLPRPPCLSLLGYHWGRRTELPAHVSLLHTSPLGHTTLPTPTHTLVCLHTPTG